MKPRFKNIHMYRLISLAQTMFDASTPLEACCINWPNAWILKEVKSGLKIYSLADMKDQSQGIDSFSRFFQLDKKHSEIILLSKRTITRGWYSCQSQKTQEEYLDSIAWVIQENNHLVPSFSVPELIKASLLL